MKRNRSPKQTKHESEMEILLRKKQILIQLLNKASNKIKKDSYWEKILLVQKEIHKKAVELYTDEYYPLWNTLSKIDCSNPVWFTICPETSQFVHPSFETSQS